jgi:hypothetical protein
MDSAKIFLRFWCRLAAILSGSVFVAVAMKAKFRPRG